MSIGCGYSLAGIVLELAARAGLDPRRINVSELAGNVNGLAVTNQYNIAAVYQSLAQIFLFDAANYDARINFIKRGKNTVATIVETDLLDDEQDIEETRRADPISIPRVLNLNYNDVFGSLATDKQTSERAGDRRATGESQLQTPVLLTADEAAQAVRVNHTIMIEEARGNLKFALPDSFIYLAPADVIFLQYEEKTERLRISTINTQDGYQEYVGVHDRQSSYVSSIQGFPASPTQLPASNEVGPTLIEPLDIHILHDVDDGVGLSFYVAIGGASEAWQGASIELSYDGGANYVDSTDATISSAMGELTSSLLDHPQEFPDTVNTCRVRLDTADTDLEESTLVGMFNRENMAIIGDELIQFAGADEYTPGVWDLSYFLRGRKGTKTESHPPGTRFILLEQLTAIPVSVTSLGRMLTFRATSYGKTVDTGTVVSMLYTGVSQTEREPAYLAARRDGTDAIVSWQGVGRLGGGATVAQGSRFVGYRVTFDDGTLPPVIVDTSAQTLTQGVGALGAPLTISVEQINSITGAGPALEVILQ